MAEVILLAVSLTPKPMTVARLQCCIVGVTRTVTVCRLEEGRFGIVGFIEMSGKDTTASAPSVMGCSGSDIELMRSKTSCSSIGSASVSESVSSLDEALDVLCRGSSSVATGPYGNRSDAKDLSLWTDALRLRVGKSEGLRTSGLAFLPSSIVIV